MEIKWIEDFVALAQTQSFSRAAEIATSRSPDSAAASRRWSNGSAPIWSIAVAIRRR